MSVGSRNPTDDFPWQSVRIGQGMSQVVGDDFVQPMTLGRKRKWFDVEGY